MGDLPAGRCVIRHVRCWMYRSTTVDREGARKGTHDIVPTDVHALGDERHQDARVVRAQAELADALVQEQAHQFACAPVRPQTAQLP